MDWFAPIDLDCERTAPGPFNEPFNALSDLAFLGTAVLATARRPARRDIFLSVLIALVYAIAMPTGTHFIWHALNAVVLYLALLSAMRFGGLAANARHT